MTWEGGFVGGEGKNRLKKGCKHLENKMCEAWPLCEHVFFFWGWVEKCSKRVEESNKKKRNLLKTGTIMKQTRTIKIMK